MANIINKSDVTACFINVLAREGICKGYTKRVSFRPSKTSRTFSYCFIRSKSFSVGSYLEFLCRAIRIFLNFKDRLRTQLLCGIDLVLAGLPVVDAELFWCKKEEKRGGLHIHHHSFSIFVTSRKAK